MLLEAPLQVVRCSGVQRTVVATDDVDGPAYKEIMSEMGDEDLQGGLRAPLASVYGGKSLLYLIQQTNKQGNGKMPANHPTVPGFFVANQSQRIVLRWLLALFIGAHAVPASAQEDLRQRELLGCLLGAHIDDVLEDSIHPDDRIVVDSAKALPEDQTQTFPTQNGTAALFNPPGDMLLTFIPKEGEPSTGIVNDTLQGVEDGPPDIVAVGGSDTTLKIGSMGYSVPNVFLEVKKDDGSAYEGVDEWPDIGAIDWDDTRCGIDLVDPNTQQVHTVLGNVLIETRAGTVTRIVPVNYGDLPKLIEEIEFANTFARTIQTIIKFVGDPDNAFVGIAGYMGTDNLLPPVVGNIAFEGAPIFDGQNDGGFRLATVTDNGILNLNGGAIAISGTGQFGPGTIKNFSVSGDGGAIKVEGHGSLFASGYILEGNTSTGGSGGAVYRWHHASFLFTDCVFRFNTAFLSGGAWAIVGSGADKPNPAEFELCSFKNNSALVSGCTAFVNLEDQAELPIQINGSAIYNSECDTSLLEIEKELAQTEINYTYLYARASAGLVSRGETSSFTSVFDSFIDDSPSLTVPARAPAHRSDVVNCVTEEPGTFTSLGYNIATDDSCNLDHPTDLPNTDPMLSEPDENGIRTPLPGSPAIDIGPSEMLLVGEDEEASLPCGWVDLKGLGRPQDGDGDGGFECDAGPVEVQGAGEIQAGHSGAFFNSLRNGEGEYVEILDGDRAVIYTFSWRPDGSGPAWFIGIANVVGNSLVTEDMLQPSGTVFGDDFDTDDIVFTNWGGMSMVFPGCTRSDTPGNVVFSGSPGLGYEPLITRAERLTDIYGCDGDSTPSPFVHLSGSYFNSDRNGEGLVVQWLGDGRVLVIMFTYAPDGGQMWIFGVAEADGTSVTIDAVYPVGFTSWGSDFEEGEVVLNEWGTFTLTWTGTDTLAFEYASTVQGYGSGSLPYRRLTRLMEPVNP